MPEIAEVKIMAEYINQVCNNLAFSKIRKSKVTKVETDLKIPFDIFRLVAESRGKELKLTLKSIHTEDVKTLICIMGMSGNWVLTEIGKQPKHSHLMFETTTHCLSFVDVRRFGKWWWGDWSQNRGPDPLMEWDSFVNNLHTNSNKKIFEKPIYQLMLDQKYFNGCGNYLRSEILYRSDINPFMSAKKAINDENFLQNCKTIIEDAYIIGGGQLKDWVNQLNPDKETFNKWLKCYGKLESIKDGGRTFWYDSKWKK